MMDASTRALDSVGRPRSGVSARPAEKSASGDDEGMPTLEPWKMRGFLVGILLLALIFLIVVYAVGSCAPSESDAPRIPMLRRQARQAPEDARPVVRAEVSTEQGTPPIPDAPVQTETETSGDGTVTF